jgi:hypothetical protein
MIYMEPAASPVLSKAKAREWLREPVRMLAVAIEDAISTNQIRRWPAEILAWTIADLTTGALQHRLATTPTTTARQHIDFLIDLIYAALRPSAG